MISSAQILINAPMLILAFAGACWLGYMIRRKSIKKLQKRVIELEDEMLFNHKQLLKLEAELARKQPFTAMSATVIPIPGANSNQKKAN
ncbi:MAG: hypothetical protein H7Y27_10505 [Gemmatimonadaceae bacterium]|nr:hypothetical protein [Chitinophagaceae bacterium]